MINNSEVAKQLESNALIIARLAYQDLATKDLSIVQRLGDEAQTIWTEYFSQKVMELSAALMAGDPQLFRDCMQWSVNAMQARSLRADDLDLSIDSLRSALMQHLTSEQLQSAIAYIDSAQAGINIDQPIKEIIGLDPGTECSRIALHYLQAVVVGNIHSGMDTIIDQVENGLSVEDAYLKVLLPAQQEVGRLWHANKLSVAEEHLVTTTTQRLMAVLAQMAPRSTENGMTVIAAAVSGNAHELGIRTITYLLEFLGWKTIYLGPDVPAADLPVTINCFDADLVLLSIGLSSQLKSLRQTIEQIRSKSQQPVSIMVGGNGFHGAPDLWRDIGADGFATSAEEALVLAQEILNQRKK